MKKLLFLTLFIACSAAAQDVTTRLTVRARNYPADSIRVRWATDNGTLHSEVMHLTDGVASTALEMPDRTQIMIDRFDDDFITVYSEDGNVEVALDNDLWPEAAISGGPFNTDHGRYWAVAGHLERLLEDVLNTTRDSSEAERLQAQRRAETYRFIAENPDREYSAYLIQVSLDRDNAEMFEGLYRKLSERVRTDTPEGIFAGRRIAELMAFRVGNPAPPFSKTDMNGNKVSLADFRGKWVLLDFWGTWCGPCRMSHPHLVEQYNEYSPRGVVFINVAIESDINGGNWRKVWTEAVESDGLVWTNIADNEFMQAEGSMVSAYGVNVFPTKVLIDPEGRLAGIFPGGEGADEALAKIQLSSRSEL